MLFRHPIQRLLHLTGAAVCAVAVSACAALSPVPDPAVTVASDRYGSTQMVGEVAVTVRSTPWRATTIGQLEAYATPLYLEIRNDGNAPVTVNLSDLIVLDDEGTLYRPLSPARLEALLSGHGTPPPGTPPPTGPDPLGYDDFRATLEAFPGGSVPPGTRMRGGVYFQRVVEWSDTVTLRITLSGETREFKFRVE